MRLSKKILAGTISAALLVGAPSASAATSAQSGYSKPGGIVQTQVDNGNGNNPGEVVQATTPERATQSSGRLPFTGQVAKLLVDKVQDGFATAVGTGVTFLPSVFGSPHLLVVYAPALAPVVQYPVPGVSPDLGPDSTQVRRRLHALDNPIRLRLARSLARSPRTTSELAELWNLSNAEVSRHLAVLKEAGLASTQRHGRRVVYLLDVTALRGLGNDLHSAFLR